MRKKKYLALALVFVFALLPSAGPSKAIVTQQIPNLNEIYVASIDLPYTVDPAACYDAASCQLSKMVYDTLICFEYESTTSFIGRAASSWALKPTPNPGYDHTWVFTIRSGMKWQNSAYGTVTPADVEYSFERWMAMDISGGAQWMIYEALLGVHGHNPTWPSSTANPIAKAIEVVGNTVEFNFVNPYPDSIFFAIIAQSWAAIICKQWAINLNTAGRNIWDGNWANWLNYVDPPAPPLDDPVPIMMGSGPYKLDYIDYISEMWRITRFADYWDSSRNYADAVTYTYVPLWADRKLLLLSDSAAAQADMVDVPRSNINDPDLLAAINAGKVEFVKDLPSLSVDAFFFNFNIPSNSPYAGDFNWGTGIPANFFADKNVRYAFAHSFNWPAYIAAAWLGEATQPATPHIMGLGYDDVYTALNAANQYAFSTASATTELKSAFGGSLWQFGFKLTIPYPSGNTALQTAAQMLESNIEAFNAARPGLPPFQIDVVEVPWPTYVADVVNVPYYKSKMPIFFMSSVADYSDPHNMWFRFFHSDGDYTYFQSYSNATVDAKIELEITQTTHADRTSTFADLFGLWKTELPSVPLVQPKERHYQRTWVNGWYYNPIDPGKANGQGFKWPPLGQLLKGIPGGADLNNDGIVNILDASLVSAWFHWILKPPLPPVEGPLTNMYGYNRYYDIWPRNQPDGQINMYEAATVNYYWGWHNP